MSKDRFRGEVHTCIVCLMTDQLAEDWTTSVVWLFEKKLAKIIKPAKIESLVRLNSYFLDRSCNFIDTI